MSVTKAHEEAVRRYNEKTYSRVSVSLPKALVRAFKQKCRERDVSQASVIKDAIQDFLSKD